MGRNTLATDPRILHARHQSRGLLTVQLAQNYDSVLTIIEK